MPYDLFISYSRVGKDDLRLALAELATPISFEFTDGEKQNADFQFERTRRELKKLADTRTPHRCLLLEEVDRPVCSTPRRSRGSTAATGCTSWPITNCHPMRPSPSLKVISPDDRKCLLEVKI